MLELLRNNIRVFVILMTNCVALAPSYRVEKWG